jgi:acetolactate synthase-1/2/3 large subunit
MKGHDRVRLPEEKDMKGSQVLMDTALKHGVDVCFANPGTTEMPLVEAMDAVSGMRPVLSLFEGVCTGAADGYGRMKGRPAMVLLHLGPGLAGGLPNLHNARRARTPVFLVVGEHSTWHRQYDPPLAMDIEALAGTVSGWQKTVASPADIGPATAAAIGASLQGRISTLVVPYDCQYEEAPEGSETVTMAASEPVSESTAAEAAGLLSGGKKTLLLLGGRALGREGLLAAARIKARSGCDLMGEMFPARMERGAGLPDVPRVPYMPEMAFEMLSKYQAVVLAGARAPVSFFGYKNVRVQYLNEHQDVLTLAQEGSDAVPALEMLAQALGAPAAAPGDVLAQQVSFPVPEGKLTPDKICLALAASQPEGAIVVDEGITTSLVYHPLSSGARPFTLLTLTGGSLGQGMPAATGAAIACPERKVISFQADGAALYSLQALWTQAREGLDVTTLIASNGRYDILRYELMRLGILAPGPAAAALTELPAIDWVRVSEGLGVPASSAATAEELMNELGKAFAERGPRLIEMKI